MQATWGSAAVVAFTGVLFYAATGGCGDDGKIARGTGGPRQPGGNMRESAEHQHTNQLIDATSPYLLQHAHNPVDWHEWGEAAFAKAQAEDKPIFLSIGYSACHWCHVMEHETFADEAAAAELNERFVCVKVDREERPDVDEIYMHVTQMMNRGQGGWPMSIFLMPDRRPIYAGTYFPRDQFISIAKRVHELWTTQRDAVHDQGDKIQAILDDWAKGEAADDTVISAETINTIAAQLAQSIDLNRGGFQTDGNKFPPSMAMELMLRVARRTGDRAMVDAVEVTLDHMARGGIYDHLGGGICRYSTDPDWLVPHFEKMLYDQALVSAIYLDAFQFTGKPLYAATARDIFEYVLGDLQAEAGGFYSTRDADSEGMEGAFYIWTVQQVNEVLGEDEGELFRNYYDVTDSGNWFESRGHAPAGPKNILHITKPPAVFAKMHGLSVEDLTRKVAAWRTKMLAARDKRVAPGLDDKILTGWNGLMIASLAKGASVLDEPKYAAAAARAADFVLANMRRDGRLLGTHRAGTSRLAAYLTDYAFMIEGLLNLYEATFDRRWLAEARSLNDVLIAHYHDEVGGAFFFTADDSETLIARTKNPRDSAIPSGNSVQAMNLLRLAKFYDHKPYRDLAAEIFRTFKQAGSLPGQFDRLACAVDMYHDRVKEIAIVGQEDDPATRALIRAVFSVYLPNKVVAFGGGGGGGGEDDGGIVPLQGKVAVDGRATAYVCENYVCKRPATTVEALTPQLGRE